MTGVLVSAAGLTWTMTDPEVGAPSLRVIVVRGISIPVLGKHVVV